MTATVTPAEQADRVGRQAAETTGALFHLDGATDGTTQWRLETFQLVNWGGFEGHHTITFDPHATLVTGHSGSGKSTLLDAYTALVMPSGTPFNGASNDAAGRARGAEQRNLLSYLRGKTDVQDGQAKVLRGARGDTWGAVAATFVSDHQARFTALRIYYVPRTATRSSDILMRLATREAEVRLDDLQEAVAERFAPKRLKALFPGLHTHDSYEVFATRLFTRLGIGANGDGRKALQLLARVQSGQQIRTVDDLYKQMVLERPETFDKADTALKHFDDLVDTYEKMTAEKAKADLLEHIPDRHQVLVTSQETLEDLDIVGLTRDGATPIALWAARTEADLLEQAVQANRADREEASAAHHAARVLVAGLEEQLAQAQEKHRPAGGGTVESLQAAIAAAGVQLAERQRARDTLTGRLKPLGPCPTTAQEYTALLAKARAFTAGYARTAETLRQRRDELVRAQTPLLDQRRTLREDLASQEGRDGRVPRQLHEMRLQVAQASGIPVSDLPFVAELIDVHPDQEQWRVAIETVLAGTARTLLVPQQRLADFSARIDALQLRGRLHFQGTPTGLDHPEPSDPGHVAGKLVYKDSPYTGWLRAHLAAPGRNPLCVPRVADLDGPGFRVTLSGQTRNGARGAHGRTDTRHIIGFSNEAAVAEITARLDRIEADLADLDAQLRELDTERSHTEAAHVAYQAVTAYEWVQIDTATVQAQIDELTAQKDKILSSDDVLRALADRIENLTVALNGARGEEFAASHRLEALAKDHADLVERQDRLTDQIEQLEAAGAVLTTAQARDLDAALAAIVGDDVEVTDRLKRFTQDLALLRRTLENRMADARERAAQAKSDLERTFRQYQERWPDANLGTTVASYPDYAQILSDIRTTGLAERSEEWRRQLTQWSGQDLVPLHMEMTSSIDEIEERLNPVNDILAALPFGPSGERLRIVMRRLTPVSVATFRRQLRELSSGATRPMTEEEMQARFKALSAFMDKIRHRDDPRYRAGVSERDNLLDVRRHVEIKAVRVDPATGEQVADHTHLNDKSGGETQELFAFIIGAALRFRLGDDSRTRPRFTPVLLDEAFIKADSQFTQRAVQAWKGLGFQLIIAAPVEKTNGLEPHVSQVLAVVKDPTSLRSRVLRLRDADTSQGQQL